LQQATCTGILLYDLQGKMAMEIPCIEKPEGVNEDKFDVSQLPKGIYMLMVQLSNGERIARRIVIQ